MTQTQDAQLSPEIVLDEMKKNGVTDVVWLPDSETNWLYQLMQAEPSLRLVPVSREGLAFSLAAGLSAGGKTPIILIQNTGLMESGDSLRGWALGLNIPVVLMVGYRGWTRHGVNSDTAATYTERFLNAFGINYYLVETSADAAAHLDRVRGGAANAAPGGGADGRRVPRLQPIGGATHVPDRRHAPDLPARTAATPSSCPAAAGGTGRRSARGPIATFRWATPRWAAMRPSPSAWPWPAPPIAWCCSTRRATS